MSDYLQAADEIKKFSRMFSAVISAGEKFAELGSAELAVDELVKARADAQAELDAVKGALASQRAESEEMLRRVSTKADEIVSEAKGKAATIEAAIALKYDDTHDQVAQLLSNAEVEALRLKTEAKADRDEAKTYVLAAKQDRADAAAAVEARKVELAELEEKIKQAQAKIAAMLA